MHHSTETRPMRDHWQRQLERLDKAATLGYGRRGEVQGAHPHVLPDSRVHFASFLADQRRIFSVIGDLDAKCGGKCYLRQFSQDNCWPQV